MQFVLLLKCKIFRVSETGIGTVGLMVVLTEQEPSQFAFHSQTQTVRHHNIPLQQHKFGNTVQ